MRRDIVYAGHPSQPIKQPFDWCCGSQHISVAYWGPLGPPPGVIGTKTTTPSSNYPKYSNTSSDQVSELRNLLAATFGLYSVLSRYDGSCGAASAMAFLLFIIPFPTISSHSLTLQPSTVRLTTNGVQLKDQAADVIKNVSRAHSVSWYL